jgi:hypothetical protein
VAGILLGPRWAWADDDRLRSQVIFGTSCARCHEGECSGRLTFDRDSEAASTHIERYAGASARAAIDEYFGQLERMKTRCSYARMELAPPEGGVFDQSLLAPLCAASQQSCFVPLGALEPRRYRVTLRLVEPRHVHAEVLTAAFELIVDEYLEVEALEADLSFKTEVRTDHFLRLRADGPLRLQRLAVEPK